MKKVLIFGGALAILYFSFAESSNTKPTTTPAPAADFASQFEGKHVLMDDNDYSIVVHNGRIYSNDEGTYLAQYFAKFGQKETTYPSWPDFYAKITNNGAIPVAGSLKMLFV